MPLGAYGKAANDVSAAGDLIGRAEEVVAASRKLRASCKTARSEAITSAARGGHLTEEIRASLDALMSTTRDLLGRSIAGFPVPQLVEKCEPGDRPRLSREHVAVAKESLAKIAAQLAGRDPEERVRIELAGYIAFDDHVWRYHDFVERAERAFAELAPSQQ